MPITYGLNQPRRLEIIEDCIQGPSTETSRFKTSDTNSELFSVYNVPLDMPKYRIQNTRTRFSQKMVMRDDGLPETAFDDSETNLAQKAQHDILGTMLVEGGLLEFFQTGNEQQHPLVLSRDGFVIVGNRRLCCWRNLFDQNSINYQHFETIRVCIFPYNADSRDARKFEALQETDQDIQSHFSWIAVAINFTEILDRHEEGGNREEGYDEIINDYKNSDYINYRLLPKRKDEINIWVNACSNALKLLEDPESDIDQDNIINQKQLFHDWAQNNHISRSPNRSLQQRKIYDIVIKSIAARPGQLGTRAYEINSRLHRNFDRVLIEFATNNDIVDDDREERDSNIINKLDELPIDDRNSETVELIDRIHEEVSWERQATATLNFLRQGNSKIQTAFNSINEHSDLTGCDSQIENIRTLLSQIEDEINSRN